MGHAEKYNSVENEESVLKTMKKMPMQLCMRDDGWLWMS